MPMGRTLLILSILFVAMLMPLRGCATIAPLPEPEILVKGPPPVATPAGWLKGNLHTHSLWSDGDEFPERIARWYRERDYDFLGISDHNSLQRGEKWVKYGDLYRKGAGPAVDALLKEFPTLAKARGDRQAGTQEIRLTPFEEYRQAIEQPGKFLLIPAEELTDKFEKKPVHMGAINIGEPIKPQGGKSVVEVISNNLKAIQSQSTRLGRPVLGHLNHPNFGWGVTAEDIAEVVEEHFFEVYNGHPTINEMGDKDHPGVERIWDVANTLRLTAFHGQPLLGLGTDDSHHYHVDGMSRAMPGRGWIYVRSKTLSAEAIIAAMEAGDFYASSGVVLREVKFDAKTKRLEIEIMPLAGAKYTTRFIGSRIVESGKPAPADIGVTYATVEGDHASYTMTGKELYIRAVVTSDQFPMNASYKGQKQQAWTQPVGWIAK